MIPFKILLNLVAGFSMLTIWLSYLEYVLRKRNPDFNWEIEQKLQLIEIWKLCSITAATLFVYLSIGAFLWGY